MSSKKSRKICSLGFPKDLIILITSAQVIIFNIILLIIINSFISLLNYNTCNSMFSKGGGGITVNRGDCDLNYNI